MAKKQITPQHKLMPFQFATRSISSHLMQGSVTVPAELVQPIAREVAQTYRNYAALPGLTQNTLPLDYVQQYFKQEISRETQTFVFQHFIIDYLFHQIARNKILLANWPRLSKTAVIDNASLLFTFDISLADTITLKEWKHFIFKAPRRKNYKDLDKQVALFLKKEQDAFKKQDKNLVESHDWVCFESVLLSHTEEPLFPDQSNIYWLRITPPELANQFQEFFFDKQIGDSFIVPFFPFSEQQNIQTEAPCLFKITIKSISKGSHLCVDFFKQNFKLKSKADVHRKLIEVFSYRNDISQRKSIIEELFHLFFTKHRFEVPKHIVTRKREALLRVLRSQPDYHVYKSHKDFDLHVETLAEKQLKEEILIDQIAYNDEIHVFEADIQHYLHLFNNERMKEFIYFKPLIDGIEESDSPIHDGVLQQAVRREKTLNYIIHTLSK